MSTKSHGGTRETLSNVSFRSKLNELEGWWSSIRITELPDFMYSSACILCILKALVATYLPKLAMRKTWMWLGHSVMPCHPGFLPLQWILQQNTWVCLKIGYIPNYSHLIGIMISKTIGFRGTRHFQTNPYNLGIINLLRGSALSINPVHLTASPDLFTMSWHQTSEEDNTAKRHTGTTNRTQEMCTKIKIIDHFSDFSGFSGFHWFSWL